MRSYMLKLENTGRRVTARDGFKGYAGRRKLRAETEKDGVPVTRVTNTIMRPTSYPPLG